jgi:hypothetical protein
LEAYATNFDDQQALTGKKHASLYQSRQKFPSLFLLPALSSYIKKYREKESHYLMTYGGERRGSNSTSVIHKTFLPLSSVCSRRDI